MPIRFGFLGGGQPIKGLVHVLDALKTLQAEGMDFHLDIWGPGQEHSQTMIDSRGLSGRVSLRGTYSPELLWSVYEQFDVAVMATLVCEALGRIPLEAAAAGLPTIAPAVGGLTELIRHDVDGLLYRFRDVDDLKRQLTRVLTDASLLPRLSANLRPVPNTRDRIPDVEAFYHEILAKRSRVPLQIGTRE
jgi:glycosyltransferase involved in cell wall biosynthesis